MLNAMVGHDPGDSTSLDRPKEDYLEGIGDGVSGLKVGLPKEFMTGDSDPDVLKVVSDCVKRLEELGCQVKELSLPHTELCVPAYYVLASAEASTNLSRYDGVRYGYRCENPENLEDMLVRTRGEGFGPEVKRRIMMGAYVLSAGYYDAYYVKAAKLRRLVLQDFDAAFGEVDFLVAPVAPCPAPELGSQTVDPVKMYLSDVFTTAANLAGLPAMSVPQGFSKDAMPIGVQLLGPRFGERTILRAAHALQMMMDVHLMVPPKV